MSIYFQLMVLGILSQTVVNVTGGKEERDPFIISLYSTGIFQKVDNPWRPGKALYFNSQEKQGYLLLACGALYPVQWKFTGVFPLAPFIFHSPKRVLATDLFRIKLGLKFGDKNVFPDLKVSLHVVCEAVLIPELRDEIQIFANLNSNESLIQPDVNSLVTDSMLIPCPTSDPTQDVLLYSRSEGGEEQLIKNVEYDPTKGFLSQEVFNGTFICRQNSSAITISAVSNLTQILKTNEFQFTPKQETIRVFTEDKIQFECLSKSNQSVRVDVDDVTKPLVKSSQVFFQPMKSYNNFGIKLSIHPLKPDMSFKGTATCQAVTENGDKVVTIKTWNFEFILTPDLYLDNKEREIVCMSKGAAPVLLELVTCSYESDCRFIISQCAGENISRCKRETGRTVTSKIINYCDGNASCVSFKYDYLQARNLRNGFAQCTVEGLVKRIEFFESLAGNKYTNWEDAPQEELVRMGDNIPSILYTNSSTEFVCEAIGYLFVDTLAFEIEFRNGSRFELKENGKTVTFLKGSENINSRKSQEYNVLTVVSIELPEEAVGMHCIALRWNSMDEIVVSKMFQIRRLTVPEFNGFPHKMLNTRTNNFRLTCSAESNPPPEYTWYFNGTMVTRVFPKLVIGFTPNGESFLEFPEVNVEERKLYAGVYICKAGNTAGSVKQRFLVEIQGDISSGNRLLSMFESLSAVCGLLVLLVTSQFHLGLSLSLRASKK